MIDSINKLGFKTRFHFTTIILVLSVLIVSYGCDNSKAKRTNQVKEAKVLNRLLTDLDYFELKEEFIKKKDILSENDVLYFEAIIESAFNNPEQSNQYIDQYFSDNKNGISRTKKNLLKTKLTNYIFLFDYANALKINEQLQSSYANQLDSSELEDLRNTHKIWSALVDIQPQELLKNEDVMLPIIKDKMGLSTIPVQFPTQTMNFIFDTGANFSVIRRSVADSLGMKLLPAQFDVEAATGVKVKSDLAVAKRIKLGEITLRNVVFLVFDDTDLSVPSLDYEINGIIGFPVIRALDEIRLTFDTLFVPQIPTEYDLDNLAYDEFMPIIKVRYQGESLRFNIDTGAPTTSLYSKFYNKYKSGLGANFITKNFNSEGAGGPTSFEGYLLDNIEFSVGESDAVLNNIQLYPERIGANDKLHGNLGQDFIQKFDTLIISFKSGAILFQ